MPAYILNWDEYKIHKSKGGTLRDFINKEYAPLTHKRTLNHLDGKEILGIYPLSQDNTSLFIAADFDQSTSKSKLWIDECRAFIQECEKHDLPVYLERSRSGTGGHVWMFFEEPFPAFKSRQLFTYFLKSSGIISEENKTSTAKSTDIDSINNQMIDGIRFEFVKKSFTLLPFVAAINC